MDYILSSFIYAIIVGRTIELRVVDMPETLNQLAMCESSGNPNAYVHNDGGSPSYGALQFKLGTFNHFGERYGIEHSDIMSKEQQFAIAEKMIYEGRWEHWYNCLHKIYE